MNVQSYVFTTKCSEPWLTDTYYQYCWIHSIIIYILNCYGINFEINFIFVEFKYKTDISICVIWYFLPQFEMKCCFTNSLINIGWSSSSDKQFICHIKAVNTPVPSAFVVKWFLLLQVFVMGSISSLPPNPTPEYEHPPLLLFPYFFLSLTYLLFLSAWSRTSLFPVNVLSHMPIYLLRKKITMNFTLFPLSLCSRPSLYICKTT